MKRELSPEVRALIVRQLGKALAESWRRQHRNDRENLVVERQQETAEVSR